MTLTSPVGRRTRNVGGPDSLNGLTQMTCEEVCFDKMDSPPSTQGGLKREDARKMAQI